MQLCGKNYSLTLCVHVLYLLQEVWQIANYLLLDPFRNPHRQYGGSNETHLHHDPLMPETAPAVNRDRTG